MVVPSFISRALERVEAWADRQDPATFRGVAVGTGRRYRDMDGPLESALLSLYVLIAIIPALLVMEEYLDSSPGRLAQHIVRHYDLSAPTATLVRSVLVQNRTHELGSMLIAVFGALFFGLGYGRVLQAVHSRAWGLDLKAREADQPRYAVVLLGLYGLILLLLVQLKELQGGPSWTGKLLAIGWIAVVFAFFLWSSHLLTRDLVSYRDLLPGAAITAAGLVVVMLISRFVMEFWVNLYARDYGGLGVVMAIFFWIAFTSTVVVLSAAAAPALKERRLIRKPSLLRPTTAGPEA